MNSSKLNEWLQLVGMSGVIASLIFVGLEMRQTRNIALSEAYQNRTEIEVIVSTAAASIPAFQSAQAKLYSGMSLAELSIEEQVALQYWIGASMSMWENDHYQYQNGYLSEEHWAKTLRHLKCDLRKYHGDLILGWAFRESFEELIAELITQVEEDSSDCWSPQQQ